MIPASYLYKDAYKQHWGEDFARRTGEAQWEAPLEAHMEAGQWSRPSPFRGLRALLARLVGHARQSANASASERDCPEAGHHLTA